MKTLAELLSNASQSTIDANPGLSATLSHPVNKNDVQVKGGSRKGHPMNKTEAEFGLRLESQKRAGEILRYEYEGITLRWADMRYTPDFVVFRTSVYDKPDLYGTVREDRSPILLIEVKGGHIWDRDIVRFKGARAYWPEFAFEMHQKTKSGWKRIY